MIDLELLAALDAIEARLACSPARVGASAVRARLREARGREAEIEIKCSVPDPQIQRVLAALCERYGIEPYRVPRQRQTGITIRAPKSFVHEVLWPILEEIGQPIQARLSAWTEELMRQWNERALVQSSGESRGDERSET